MHNKYRCRDTINMGEIVLCGLLNGCAAVRVAHKGGDNNFA